MEYNDLTKQTIQDGLQNSSQVNDGRDHFTRTRNNERSLPYDLDKTMVRKKQILCLIKLTLKIDQTKQILQIKKMGMILTQ